MNTEEIQWCPTLPTKSFYSNEAHVWRVCLDPTMHDIEKLQEILSVDERARAGRFRFERDQSRFIVARGILRKILGNYLGKNPQSLCFGYNPYGKPALAVNRGYDSLDFNVSHADAFAVYAVTHRRNIGIDIERVRDDIAIGQIADRFFSKDEIICLENIEKSKRSYSFFQYWTRKEAFIKALGKGLSFPMEQCEVSLLNGRSLSPYKLKADDNINSFWFGQDVYPGHGYVAAIAVEGGDWDFSYWDYIV